MQIYNLGWLALPVGIYFTLKKYHLHIGELWLLLYANLLIISTVIDGWPMQITHLIIVTALSMQMLSISKQTSGLLPQKKYPLIVRLFLHLEQQLSIIVYVIAAWLCLRVYTTQLQQYGIGLQISQGKHFQGINKTLHGWNCTQLQIVIIPSLWVVINILSYYIGREIIATENDKDNLYKEYAVKYVIGPFVLLSLVVLAVNLWSYYNADTLLQCVYYWDSYASIGMKLALYCGYASSVIYFFHVKKGLFLVEGEGDNTSDMADNEQ